MPEAAQVPGLSQDGERVDRPDAWDGPQAYEVRMCSKQVAGLLFDLITLGDQMPSLTENETKHADRWRLRIDRQANGISGCGVYISEQPSF